MESLMRAEREGGGDRDHRSEKAQEKPKGTAGRRRGGVSTVWIVRRWATTVTGVRRRRWPRTRRRRGRTRGLKLGGWCGAADNMKLLERMVVKMGFPPAPLGPLAAISPYGHERGKIGPAKGISPTLPKTWQKHAGENGQSGRGAIRHIMPGQLAMGLEINENVGAEDGFCATAPQKGVFPANSQLDFQEQVRPNLGKTTNWGKGNGRVGTWAVGGCAAGILCPLFKASHRRGRVRRRNGRKAAVEWKGGKLWRGLRRRNQRIGARRTTAKATIGKSREVGISWGCRLGAGGFRHSEMNGGKFAMKKI